MWCVDQLFCTLSGKGGLSLREKLISTLWQLFPPVVLLVQVGPGFYVFWCALAWLRSPLCCLLSACVAL